MNTEWSDNGVVADKFAVAQVALYIFAILQVVVALMTASGAISLGSAPQASTMQRVSATANVVITVLFFTVGYVLLARCLNRCTSFIWRIALSVFLINTGTTALALVAQPGPYPVLTCSLSIAGVISVWNGRKAVRKHAGN